jgi:predicted GIY-YIG superfamily endonuclease
MGNSSWIRVGVINTDVRDKFVNNGLRTVIETDRGGSWGITQHFTVCGVKIDFEEYKEKFTSKAVKTYLETEVGKSVAKENNFFDFYIENINGDHTYNYINTVEGKNFIKFIIKNQFKIEPPKFLFEDKQRGLSFDEEIRECLNNVDYKYRSFPFQYGWAINVGESRPYWSMDCREIDKKVFKIISNKNIENKNQYVYTIKLRDKHTKEVWYYVGLSKNPANRLKNHLTKNYNCTTNEILLTDVVDIEACENRKHAQKREREKFFEIVQEKETENVLGGR